MSTFSGTIQFEGIGAVSVNGANTGAELLAKLQAAVDAKLAQAAALSAAAATANTALNS